MEMEYRRLGDAGLKVSVLSFGSWVTFHNQLGHDSALECMQAAWDAGVNFFDNAEVYAGGKSETIMGEALRELGWPRESYVLSTKLYWGLRDGPNTKNTLNRKYLMHGIDGSLERLGLDHVDILFCHRPDPETPVEETVWAMSDIVASGKALYWGTSEWPADAIEEAYQIAERNRIRKPVTEQPQYNLLWRDRVEHEYAPLYDQRGMGATVWSPLASGALTGKYLDGIPEGSRAALPGYEWLRDLITSPDNHAQVRRVVDLAEEIGCTPAQLAIAWCAKNPNVSTVITGASRVAQVHENMGALEVLPRLTDEILARLEGRAG
ncbi:MAG TPA: aldo/keto reductase [Polyangiales bacterium]|nr:aldo/keto reductase [Polyangiales bacterium]